MPLFLSRRTAGGKRVAARPLAECAVRAMNNGVDAEAEGVIASLRLNQVGENDEERMTADEERPRDTAIMLGVLSAVERDSTITQRNLSNELGIALGLANAYLKRCVRKGLIKVTQAPLNRYGYYLTPTGFAEKSRLTGEYLALSFKFFRDSRRSCTALFGECRARGYQRVALGGAGELAEVAVLSAAEAGIDIDCVIDAQSDQARCAGRPVVAGLAEALARANAGGIDAIVVTDTTAPQETYDLLAGAARDAGLAEEVVIAPDLLRISRRPAAQLERSGETAMASNEDRP